MEWNTDYEVLEHIHPDGYIEVFEPQCEKCGSKHTSVSANGNIYCSDICAWRHAREIGKKVWNA